MSLENLLVGVEIDKCTESFSVKIPDILKSGVDKLSPPQKSKLKEEILFVMAKHIHDSLFDPSKYLSSRDQ